MFPTMIKRENKTFLLLPDLALVKQNKKVRKSFKSDSVGVTQSYLFKQSRQGYSYIDVLSCCFRFARDNVFNFIKFCRMLEVMEVVMFETEDLVSQEQTQSFHS